MNTFRAQIFLANEILVNERWLYITTENHLFKCNACSHFAKGFCARCNDDPAAPNAKTYYCSTSCLLRDIAAHERACDIVLERKRGFHIPALEKVHRIADLLQQMHYTFWEHIFPGRLARVEVEGKTLKAYYHSLHRKGDGLPQSHNGLECLFSFPKNIVEDTQIKYRILAHGGAFEAVALTRDLAEYLLDGVCTSPYYYELCIIPQKRDLDIACFVDGMLVSQSDGKANARVVLGLEIDHGGGQQIIDLCGAELLPFHDVPVVPASEYLQEIQVDTLLSTKAPGSTKVQLEGEMKLWKTQNSNSYVPHLQWVIRREASKLFLNTTKTWMEETQITKERLMEMDFEEYRTERERLLERFVDDIKATLAEMGHHYEAEKDRINRERKSYAEIRDFILHA